MAVEDTVYVTDDERVRSCPISAGDFFTVVKGGREDDCYAELYGFSAGKNTRGNGSANQEIGGALRKENGNCGYAVYAHEKAADASEREKTESGWSAVGTEGTGTGELQWDDLRHRLEQVKSRLAELKSEDEDLTHEHAEEIRRLRQEKKELSAKLAEPARQQIPAKYLVKFKNCLYATSFSAVVGAVPQAANVCFPQFWERPLFTAGLDQLKNAVQAGRRLGISGGPCLFGVHEVLVTLKLKDGTSHTYDFSSGRHYQAGSERDLAEDMETNAGNILSIEFTDQKKGVTTQEYDSIRCLFEMASALQASLAIPLPDMSYVKFFQNITGCLSPKLAEDARRRFRDIAVRISGLYREVIEELAAVYPNVTYAVVDLRSEELLQVFYEKRVPFLTESSVKRLTAVRGKTEAVLDYITMPALPYYLWGLTDIVQMDCLDETDSYRKCAKLHRGKLRLYAMLYPERISRDGENTIFYAPLEYKDYMTPEQYRSGWQQNRHGRDRIDPDGSRIGLDGTVSVRMAAVSAWTEQNQFRLKI